MIIRLKDSVLFRVDPAIRFADEYKVSQDIWRELWRRYRLLDYSTKELCEVFYIQVGKPISRRNMELWIFRGRIYSMVNDKVKMGVECVSSEVFGELEQRVINEVLRHIKSGSTATSRLMA